MILLDLNQTMYANLFVMIAGGVKGAEIDEKMLRHMVLNSIRATNMKFKNDYGGLVIAADGHDYWRKKFYPYYKYKRVKSRENDKDIDWKKVFESFSVIREEIRNNLPYKYVCTPEAEADDIIASIIAHGNSQIVTSEKYVIVSGDKDFNQLLRHKNVKQYHPIQKKFIACKDPNKFLYDHIVHGDGSDCIPNIRSCDETFVSSIRQKPINAKFLQSIDGVDPNNFDAELRRNYDRNRTLIDFECIPTRVHDAVIAAYDAFEPPKRSGLFNYFVTKKLKNLLETVGDF